MLTFSINSSNSDDKRFGTSDRAWVERLSYLNEEDFAEGNLKRRQHKLASITEWFIINATNKDTERGIESILEPTDFLYTNQKTGVLENSKRKTVSDLSTDFEINDDTVLLDVYQPTSDTVEDFQDTVVDNIALAYLTRRFSLYKKFDKYIKYYLNNTAYVNTKLDPEGYSYKQRTKNTLVYDNILDGERSGKTMFYTSDRELKPAINIINGFFLYCNFPDDCYDEDGYCIFQTMGMMEKLLNYLRDNYLTDIKEDCE